MSKLKQLGIVVRKNGKAEIIFNSLFPDFQKVECNSPSDYVSKYWNSYLKHPKSNNNINGKIFEYILATLFVRVGLLPLYLSSKVAFVPNVNYDMMLYTSDQRPICISAKTSLRERYKQADLEAIVLKNVHRKAQCYLVTINKKEARSVKAKIENGEVIGLDNVLVATSEEFDKLITYLKKIVYSEAKEITVIKSNQIVTYSKVIELENKTLF